MVMIKVCQICDPIRNYGPPLTPNSKIQESPVLLHTEHSDKNLGYRPLYFHVFMSSFDSFHAQVHFKNNKTEPRPITFVELF